MTRHQQDLFALCFFFCAIFSDVVFAQISPGPLARAHEQLEGLTKCLTCHEVGQKLSNGKCLKCHTTIAERVLQQRGYHATAMAKNSNRPCAACHSEHNGRAYALIVWEKGEVSFDHREAGYVLEGGHASVACRDCHQQKNIQEKFANDANVRLAKTFLGLAQNCLSCHADEHRGQLGTACESCHNFAAWKPAAKFAHERAQFVLTGKHRSVACAKCHLEKTAREQVGNEASATFVQYTGLQFSNCTPCHQDPHRGSFGNACAKCHNTEGWRRIAGGAFNHDLTDFPLRGRHRSVVCEKCHTSGNFKKQLAHQFCRGCHQDAHAGQFAQRSDNGRCESCHTVEGFTPSQFKLAEHQKTAFPLRGAHLATPCSICHARQPAGALAGKLLFVFAESRCQTCHLDAHAGQFTARMAKGDCDICHRNESWHETKFDHNTARFKLAGAHLKVACGKCHPQEQANATAVFAPPALTLGIAQNRPASFKRYHPLAFRCVDCHADVHRGQFGKKEQARCEKCHQSTLWSELSFVHNRDSAFKLDGAHAKVQCEKCHVSKAMKDRSFVVVYKPMRKECVACHQ